MQQTPPPPEQDTSGPRLNRYPLPCRDCEEKIAPGKGKVWQYGGRWYGVHIGGCPEGTEAPKVPAQDPNRDQRTFADIESWIHQTTSAPPPRQAQDKPEQGKTYVLTSADGPCIASGDSWADSEVAQEATQEPLAPTEGIAAATLPADLRRFHNDNDEPNAAARLLAAALREQSEE